MECCNNIIGHGHAARLYRGETLVGDFTLYDDNGAIVTGIEDVVVLLTDRSGTQEPLVKTLSNGGVEFSNGNLRFVVDTAESAALPDKVDIEIKVVVSGITRIATKQLLTVVDDIVKDY